MTRFFVVSTDPVTPDQEKQLTEYLKANGGWWHWLPNFWLVRDNKDLLVASGIRDKIRQVAPAARCLVLEVDPISWSAMSRPDAKGNSMTSWVDQQWKKNPPV